MNTPSNDSTKSPSLIEATWQRERSSDELRSFIEQRQSSIVDDIDLAFDGLF